MWPDFVQVYSIIADLAHKDRTRWGDDQQGSRRKDRTDPIFYMNVCLAINNTPIFTFDDVYEQNVRRRRQAGKHLTEDQKHVRWIPDDF